jgi:serine/threonine protein kinase
VHDVGKDFLRRLLAFNPTERATAEEALGHPWLRDVATGPADAPGANSSGGQQPAEGADILPFEGADIEAADEASDLRPLLWREILHYH